MPPHTIIYSFGHVTFSYIRIYTKHLKFVVRLYSTFSLHKWSWLTPSGPTSEHICPEGTVWLIPSRLLSQSWDWVPSRTSSAADTALVSVPSGHSALSDRSELKWLWQGNSHQISWQLPQHTRLILPCRTHKEITEWIWSMPYDTGFFLSSLEPQTMLLSGVSTQLASFWMKTEQVAERREQSRTSACAAKNTAGVPRGCTGVKLQQTVLTHLKDTNKRNYIGDLLRAEPHLTVCCGVCDGKPFCRCCKAQWCVQLWLGLIRGRECPSWSLAVCTLVQQRALPARRGSTTSPTPLSLICPPAFHHPVSPIRDSSLVILWSPLSVPRQPPSPSRLSATVHKYSI